MKATPSSGIVCPHNETENKKFPSSKVKTGEATCSYDYVCPQLLGLPKTLMTRIGKILGSGISPFLSAQWAEAFGLTSKEAAAECRAMYIQNLVNRNKVDQIYRYTFRFTKEEFDSAIATVEASIRSEDGETILATIERSETKCNRKAVDFIRKCSIEGKESFYPAKLQNWGKLPEVDAKAAMTVLEERGIIKRPMRGKYRIVMHKSINLNP